MERAFKYWADVFKSFGVGLMVASFVLKISKEVDESVLLALLMLGLLNVGFGAIFFLVGGKGSE